MQNIFKYQYDQKNKVTFKETLFNEIYRGKTVLITGGGGSIGSELAFILLNTEVKKVVILDISELAIFNLKSIISDSDIENKLIYKIGDIKNQIRINEIFKTYNPQVIIHSAAYKHLDIMEENPVEAYENNYIGTKILFEESLKFKVKEFIFITTDKAIEPINIMGLTKKMSEIFLKKKFRSNLNIRIIRFGNVLFSNGSLIPLIKKQIKNNSVVTYRGRNTKRFFIHPKTLSKTILNLLTTKFKNSVFLIEMGKPIMIKDIISSLIKESKSQIELIQKPLLKGEKEQEKLKENYEQAKFIKDYNCYLISNKYNSYKDESVFFEIYNQFEKLHPKDFNRKKEYLSSIINSLKYINFAKK